MAWRARDFPGTGALIKVARVLMKQRGKNCSTDKDVCDCASIGSAKALTITFRALHVVGLAVRSLVDACEYAGSGDAYDVGCGMECELVLQLCCKRHKPLIVGDVEVRDDAEEALLLLIFNLLESELLGLDRGDRGLDNAHGQLDICQVELLSRLKGRSPAKTSFRNREPLPRDGRRLPDEDCSV